MSYITDNPIYTCLKTIDNGAGTGLAAFTLTYKILSSLNPEIPTAASNIYNQYGYNKDRKVFISKKLSVYIGISPYIALEPSIIIRHVDSYIKKYIGIDKSGYYIFNERLWNVLDIPYNQTLNIINLGRILSLHYLSSLT